jgi:hypothetical protein
MNQPLGTVALGPADLGLAVLLAVVPFACVEIGKALLRRAGWTLGWRADA